MLDRRLGQTLIVAPATTFAQIADTLQTLGWQREAMPDAGAALIADEPLAARWTWQGHKPYIIYTFNPVARLRVLDVATLPPMLRRALVQSLPVLTQQDIDHLFFAEEPRRRLLGLWAAQETERIDLIGEAQRLGQDSDQEVARQALPVARRLQRVSAARLEVFAQLQVLTHVAPDLIRRLDDPVFVASLKPDLAACEKLFDPQVASAAQAAAASWYEPGICLHRISPDAEITVTAAAAGMLRWSNELSEKFPGAFREISGWMVPQPLWLTWTIREPRGSTVRHDGLAWIGDRWVWLPKIYRALVPLCMGGAVAQTTH